MSARKTYYVTLSFSVYAETPAIADKVARQMAASIKHPEVGWVGTPDVEPAKADSDDRLLLDDDDEPFDINASPSYRDAMNDSGRGGLLR